MAGFIPYALMAPALAEGYATSGTDTGHVGNNADFMPGHPEKLIDFAYRSTHEMAVAAKGRHRRLLRQRAEMVVLQRLLRRRQARPDQCPTLP